MLDNTIASRTPLSELCKYGFKSILHDKIITHVSTWTLGNNTYLDSCPTS